MLCRCGCVIGINRKGVVSKVVGLEGYFRIGKRRV